MIVSYYYKKKTKYPERILVFYGIWPMRNLRRFGNLDSLYSRVITAFESDNLVHKYRMTFRAYENWNDLWDDHLNFDLEGTEVMKSIALWAKSYKLDGLPLEEITYKELIELASSKEKKQVLNNQIKLFPALEVELFI